MRKDTPVNTQLPEWKKEVAEKVKAYEERKKRLTTPPQPLKQASTTERQQEVTTNTPTGIPATDNEFVERASVRPIREPVKRVTQTISNDPVSLEVWTEDLEGVIPAAEPAVVPSRLEIMAKLPEDIFEEEESNPVTSTYSLRRSAALVIDHVILLALAGMVVLAISLFTQQRFELLLITRWKAVLCLSLALHMAYFLYFWKSSRQTPGMLFVSLELRDPVLSSIPISKLVMRWIILVLFNVFNFIPVLMGKDFLLLDRISNTRIRSF